MSLAITHFVVGASATVLVVTFFLPRIRFPRTLMVLGGLWAMIPDLNKGVPAQFGFVDAIHDSSWANVFWAHRFLDVTDPTDTTQAAVGALALFFVVSLVAEGVGYHLRFSEPDAGTARPSAAAAPSTPPFRLAHGVRRAGGLCSLVVGAGLFSYILRTPKYTGLFAGLGLLLGLSGIVVLLEGVEPDGVVRRIPELVSTGAKTALTLGSSLLVVALLVTLSDVTPLSVAYAGLSVLILLQLVRLWELPI
ncbi:hypothetical protein SAMN04488063_2725 [Halopelagius inordinatus]|uniref:Uncharacterized protein n=1 Tax=Halopelagius inordinatus TaxID=553467 RepID=A0A1I2U2C5_9EURY|nr:hypothetical protein [Halopelagius inordinatus]SFG70569.1 hypothetical protein SAMN04488063_2725 [Halopelagius inordinatus]